MKCSIRIAEAGVQTELHVYPSVPYGLVLFALEQDVYAG